MRYPLFILFCFAFANVIADSISLDTSVVIPSGHPIQVKTFYPDTLTLKQLPSEQTDANSLDTHMPWIVAFVIGLLSVLMARQSRISNERNLRSQIESSERNLQRQIESSERNMQRQIESNERNAQRQIDANKETLLTEFKATIATKNRQEWINDLRHTLSDYIASLSLVAPLFRMPNPNAEVIEERKQLIHRMSLSKAKLELLMNEEKPEQKALLNEVEKMLLIVTNTSTPNIGDAIVEARYKIIVAGRKLFGVHWMKIKELR